MITRALLRSWKACYTDEQLEQLVPLEGLTPRQVAEHPTVPQQDKLWVLCQTIAYLDENAARMFAIECASQVTHLSDDPDEHAGILNDLMCVFDLPVDQQAEARSAAWSAAWSAAESAASRAWSAAYYAARSAAESAAYCAAYYAAESAAYCAAYYAAESAAWSAARTRALEWLGDYAEGWGE